MAEGLSRLAENFAKHSGNKKKLIMATYQIASYETCLLIA